MTRVPPTATRPRRTFEDDLAAKLAFEASRAEAQELRFPTTRCHARVGATNWRKRERPDGTTYSFPMDAGEQCPNEAVATRCINGRAVHRCAEHPFPAAATRELARAS